MATLDHDTAFAPPFFDGYPYWTTHVARAICHITVLPRGPVAMLDQATALQVRANQLPIWLVLAADRALYIEPGGHARLTDQPPRGGFLFADQLAPVLPADPEHPDFRARAQRLAALLRTQPRHGAIFGDLTKGGRPATPDELRTLHGVQDDGTPNGLSRCGRCHDWSGICLDPSEAFAGQVMRVHCRCDNHNRCARCGELLAGRRLNANFWDPADRAIWHVPGFEAFGHQCAR